MPGCDPMNLAAKIATGASAAVVAVGLVALTAPAVVPFLPHGVQVALAGPVEPIDTVPGTVDDLFRSNGLAEHNVRDSHVSHADVEALYVASAKVWPWDLPAGFQFPSKRGVADTPGPHHRSMGLQAAFSKYAVAVLAAVEAGDYAPDPSRPLDELQDAYQTLFDAGVLGDRRFVEDSIDPLRADAPAASPTPGALTSSYAEGDAIYVATAAAFPMSLPAGYHWRSGRAVTAEGAEIYVWYDWIAANADAARNGDQAAAAALDSASLPFGGAMATDVAGLIATDNYPVLLQMFPLPPGMKL